MQGHVTIAGLKYFLSDSRLCRDTPRDSVMGKSHTLQESMGTRTVAALAHRETSTNATPKTTEKSHNCFPRA